MPRKSPRITPSMFFHVLPSFLMSLMLEIVTNAVVDMTSGKVKITKYSEDPIAC